MPKSKGRKKKSNVRKDMSGKVFKKSNVNEIRRKMTMRHMFISQACESLTSSEIKEILDRVPFTGSLSYIETKLDENGVPVEGETKEMKIGGSSDYERLSAVHRSKVAQEKAAEEKVED